MSHLWWHRPEDYPLNQGMARFILLTVLAWLVGGSFHRVERLWVLVLLIALSAVALSYACWNL